MLLGVPAPVQRQPRSTCHVCTSWPVESRGLRVAGTGVTLRLAGRPGFQPRRGGHDAVENRSHGVRGVRVPTTATATATGMAMSAPTSGILVVEQRRRSTSPAPTEDIAPNRSPATPQRSAPRELLL